MYLRGLGFAGDKFYKDPARSFQWELENKDTVCCFNTSCPTAIPWYFLKECPIFLVVNPKAVFLEFFKMPEYSRVSYGNQFDRIAAETDDPHWDYPNEAWFAHKTFEAFYIPHLFYYVNHFHRFDDYHYKYDDYYRVYAREDVLEANEKLGFPIKYIVHQDVHYYVEVKTNEYHCWEQNPDKYVVKTGKSYVYDLKEHKEIYTIQDVHTYEYH